MSLEITGISDRGVLAEERIGFSVDGDTDLQFYLVYKAEFLGQSIDFENQSDAVFWFTSIKAKAGDKVVLYTKSGQASSRKNPDGTSIYFFYWIKTEPLFSALNKGVVLVNINSWRNSQGRIVPKAE